METTMKKNGRKIEVNNAKIRYRNFEGRKTDFNKAGERNFVWQIEDEDMANDLGEWGYNVRAKMDRDGNPVWHLKVKVNFREDGSGPDCFLVTGRKQNKIDPEDLDVFDSVTVKSFDMDIVPYEWSSATLGSGITAYLNACWMVQECNRFEQRILDMEEMDDEDAAF